METYTDYLKSEHWAKRRRRWYAKPGNDLCRFCSSTQSLNIHHRRYYSPKRGRILYHERDGDLITLCQSCHFLWHSIFSHKIHLTQKRENRIIVLNTNGMTLEEAMKNTQRKATFKKALRLLKPTATKRRAVRRGET